MSDLPLTAHRIAVVTAHPPGRGPLNEYGAHFIRHLATKSEVAEVIALTDELPGELSYPAIDGVLFDACWRFGGVGTALRIAAAVRRHRPDAVVFNQHFASYASGRVASALALLSPLLVRLLGVRTLVLQHNIVETVDLDSAGFGGNRAVLALYRAIGTILTWLILRAHTVAVTIPAYVEVLREKYGADNVVLIPHGSFTIPERPDFGIPDGPNRILAFGKFGTYKTVEPLIAAFRRLQASDRDVELIIAGTDSPNAPGYLDRVQRSLGGQGVHFTGYVEEEDVPDLFRSATAVVFPYTSTTGSSGVLHQAGEHGRAAVLPDIGDFAAVIRAEGYIGEFFEPDDVDGLADAITRLIDEPMRRFEQGRQNWAASTSLPLEDLVDWYLLHLAA